MVNIRGQRFDLMRPGRHVLLQIPASAVARDTLLRVEADAEHLGKACADVYFRSINLSGAWAERESVGGFHFRAGGDREQLKWTRLGEVDLKVIAGHTQEGVSYLNMFVRFVKSVTLAIGGLLGGDDHREAASRPERCRSVVSFVAAPAVNP